MASCDKRISQRYYLAGLDPVVALLLGHLLHVKVLSVDITTANFAIEVAKGDGSCDGDKVEGQSDQPKPHPLSIMRRRRRGLVHDLVLLLVEPRRDRRMLSSSNLGRDHNAAVLSHLGQRSNMDVPLLVQDGLEESLGALFLEEFAHDDPDQE